MNRSLDKLASEFVSKLDVDEWTHDTSKDIASLFTVDVEGIREVLLVLYKAGFADGYRVARGAKVDDWGNLVDNEEE